MAVRVVGGNGRTVNPYEKRESLPDYSGYQRRRRPWRLYEVPQQSPPPHLSPGPDKMPGAIRAGFEQTQYLPEPDRIAIERIAWRVLPVARPDKDLERTFRALADQWYKDTRTTSSLRKMINNPAYLRIIGKGPEAVPLLLRELERTRDHWLAALHYITGEDPASPEASFEEAVDAWLAWGRQEGFV